MKLRMILGKATGLLPWSNVRETCLSPRSDFHHRELVLRRSEMVAVRWDITPFGQCELHKKPKG